MASKAVRQNKEVPDGGKFKRYYCSWDICDYRSKSVFYTTEDFRKKWYDKTCGEFDRLRRRFVTWKEAYRHWLRWYRMK